MKRDTVYRAFVLVMALACFLAGAALVSSSMERDYALGVISGAVGMGFAIFLTIVFFLRRRIT